MAKPKLPPVRKRENYSDIRSEDLVFALFHDRIITPGVLRPKAYKASSEDTAARRQAVAARRLKARQRREG